MISEWPEVAFRPGQIEQQPHHQRRAEAFFRGIDAALDQERRAHAERDVERRDEAEVEPVGALERYPLAQRATQRVGRDEDPLRARAMRRAEMRELGNERIHATTFLHQLAGPHQGRAREAHEPRATDCDD